jgi:hypothetical protein
MNHSKLTHFMGHMHKLKKWANFQQLLWIGNYVLEILQACMIHYLRRVEHFCI